jgi:hypothetical protein
MRYSGVLFVFPPKTSYMLYSNVYPLTSMFMTTVVRLQDQPPILEAFLPIDKDGA